MLLNWRISGRMRLQKVHISAFWEQWCRKKAEKEEGVAEGEERDRTSSHLSKTRNTYARKIDDVLVGVLMTREMDVRTETLYILRGGKNIMYYTLLRRASLPPSRSPSWRKGGAQPTTAASFAWILEKKVRNFMQATKRDVTLGCARS